MKAALLALALAVTPGSYLRSHQQPDGGFAEAGGKSSPELTAWTSLGLAATGHPPSGASAYLSRQPTKDATDLALRILALEALGADTERLVIRFENSYNDLSTGRIGDLVNSTIWGILALRAYERRSGHPKIRKTNVQYLIRQQRPSGGWSWYPRGAPDSNDTAAAIQALRSVGVKGRPIRRGLAYLRTLERKDGGFALVTGRPSDSQSTAWAIQAFIAAGKKPPAAAFRFLGRMRRADGSYRYSTRYAVTPVWVTAQVLPALARKSFPLG
jgi:Squalene-hopene cyclase C-terminal domain/Prenyltransferase and squalene oxidase repeat